MEHDFSQYRICIIGLGLIGGSFAAALKQAGFTGQITGVVRSKRTGERALELGVVDKVTSDIAEGASDADVVMLAVPMLSMREQLEKLQTVVKDDAIITDAGSVKTPFVNDALHVFGDLTRIVPGHPIAGRELSGIDAIDVNLYQDRRVLLTPTVETSPNAIELVTRLWQLAGGIVECLTPEHHDRVLAATSHLPHVLAFALVDVLATQQEAEEIFAYAAGGFRDSTRIASGDPIMWRDICMTNRQPLCEAIDKLQQQLSRLKTAISEGDADTLESTFARAKHARDTHIIK